MDPVTVYVVGIFVGLIIGLLSLLVLVVLRDLQRTVRLRKLKWRIEAQSRGAPTFGHEEDR